MLMIRSSSFILRCTHTDTNTNSIIHNYVSMMEHNSRHNVAPYTLHIHTDHSFTRKSLSTPNKIRTTNRSCSDFAASKFRLATSKSASIRFSCDCKASSRVCAVRSCSFCCCTSFFALSKMPLFLVTSSDRRAQQCNSVR